MEFPKRINMVTWDDGSQIGPNKDDNFSYIEFVEWGFGDHNETWILVYKNGHEVSRHNARYAKDIVWENE